MLLLPLEVLPGWPEAPPVSQVSLLFIMVLAPIATIALLTALAFAPRLAKGDTDDGGVDPVEGNIFETSA